MDQKMKDYYDGLQARLLSLDCGSITHREAECAIRNLRTELETSRRRIDELQAFVYGVSEQCKGIIKCR